MPVRLLRRLTGTALRAVIRSLARTQGSSPPPPTPPLPPTRFIQGRKRNYTPPASFPAAIPPAVLSASETPRGGFHANHRSNKSKRSILYRTHASGTVQGIIKGKPFPQPPGIATLPIRPNAPHPGYRRKRGMARRRSPPRRGGSSDAARTLVSRHARDSGRAEPNAARQEGGRGTTLADLQIVTVGCPNAGLGVVGGKGLRKPLIPCPISAVDARKAPASPNGHGPAGRHSVARREATTPGCRAAAAGQRKKREPCSGKKIDDLAKRASRGSVQNFSQIF